MLANGNCGYWQTDAREPSRPETGFLRPKNDPKVNFFWNGYWINDLQFRLTRFRFPAFAKLFWNCRQHLICIRISEVCTRYPTEIKIVNFFKLTQSFQSCSLCSILWKYSFWGSEKFRKKTHENDPKVSSTAEKNVHLTQRGARKMSHCV